MTMRQFNAFVTNIEYVVKESKNFGKPPAIKLPSLPITKYAARCGVIIPYEIHVDLLKKGFP